MAKADAHDLDPAVGGEGLPRELDQPQDPGLVQVRAVLAAADQHGVDGVQVRVGGGFWVVVVVDDVVGREGEVRLQGVGRDGTAEQVGEDAAVAVELGVGVGQRRVGLEDGEADGRGGGGRRHCLFACFCFVAACRV